MLVEKGLAASTIDCIAMRAGVAKGTFYHYFHDRAAMLEALRKRYSQHFADSVQAEMNVCDADDWQAQLDGWIAAVVREYGVSYALHDVIFHDPSVCHRNAMSEEAIVQNLAALLERGKSAGTWEIEDPLETAVCMFHGLHGLVDEAIVSGADPVRVAPRLSRLFANMLRAP
ncbi:TetR/AcrR family transcriptional regulator (plasmid) [Rhizorhabdus wittichii]|uniref:TetR/AcrR family transcriptional regulator n=1 Tax=Rhizorhabdus wittichii TaxID=160791 RepID=A0A975HGU1_9SPHN|nr:TetR/AcrR family transcriptional regulator [Rhizorhabdus wittichii]